MAQLLPAAAPPPRIDLGELKSQLADQLGPERARRYFGYLHQLLSQKLSKTQFDRLCFSTLGRENVSLHNQLIQSVIKNAFLAKTPPPVKKPSQRDDLLKPPHSLAWSGNEILPRSPKRRRSVTQRSKPGLYERAAVSVLENGGFHCHDLKRRQEGDGGEQAEQPEKMRRLESNGGDDVLPGEERGFIRRQNYESLSHAPLEAPLGIPFFPPSAGSARRLLSPVGSTTNGSFRSCSDTAELCGTEDLRKRMERIAERHGLGGVELDSANLLNNGLDAYLKRLIKSSLELVRTKVPPKATKQPVPKQKAYNKPINGVRPDSSTHIHGGSPLDVQEKNCFLIALQDFTIAMKLNPHQLGQDASLWLEKISLHSFE